MKVGGHRRPPATQRDADAPLNLCGPIPKYEDLSAAEREVWDYQEWSERHERH